MLLGLSQGSLASGLISLHDLPRAENSSMVHAVFCLFVCFLLLNHLGRKTPIKEFSPSYPILVDMTLGAFLLM